MGQNCTLFLSSALYFLVSRPSLYVIMSYLSIIHDIREYIWTFFSFFIFIHFGKSQNFTYINLWLLHKSVEKTAMNEQRKTIQLRQNESTFRIKDIYRTKNSISLLSSSFSPSHKWHLLMEWKIKMFPSCAWRN
jgi:hypothetical protein